MADQQTLPVDQPFHVIVVLDGKENFVDGYAAITQAEASAERRNSAAQELGIASRYEAREGAYSAK